MRIHLLTFILSGLFAQPALALINGAVVSDNSYIQVGRFWMDQMACSGTLVGPRVFLTAAHCLTPFGLQTHGHIEIGVASNFPHSDLDLTHEETIGSPYFGGVGGDSPNDLAVMILPEEIKGVTPVSVYTQALNVGDVVTLAGWGDTDWKFDKLRVGQNHVKGYPDGYMENEAFDQSGIQSQGGDSGGAVLIERDGTKFLAAVILGSGENVTAATTLSSKESIDFLKTVALKNNLQICGINVSCAKTGN